MDFDRADDWVSWTDWMNGPVRALPTRECDLVRCEPGWSWQVRTHDWDLWLVVDGYGTGVVNGVHYELSPGDLLHPPPGSNGEVHQDPHRRFTIAFCHYDWWDTALQQRVTLPSSLQLDTYAHLADPVTVRDRLQTVIRLSRDHQPLVGPERSALLQLTLVHIYRQQAIAAGLEIRSVDPRIDRIVTQLRSDPGSRLSLEDAARCASMSPQHFSRIFTDQLGTSFRSYVLNNRMDRASTLLTESTMRIGEIATALGYSDIYLFSRQFSKRFGHSPTRHRSRPD